jgi:hypothetical protein
MGYTIDIMRLLSMETTFHVNLIGRAASVSWWLAGEDRMACDQDFAAVAQEGSKAPAQVATFMTIEVTPNGETIARRGTRSAQ